MFADSSKNAWFRHRKHVSMNMNITTIFPSLNHIAFACLTHRLLFNWKRRKKNEIKETKYCLWQYILFGTVPFLHWRIAWILVCTPCLFPPPLTIFNSKHTTTRCVFACKFNVLNFKEYCNQFESNSEFVFIPAIF